MERSKYVDIELQFENGQTETIEIEREIFAKLALTAFEKGKSVEEVFIELLQEEMDRADQFEDGGDIIIDKEFQRELDEKENKECPNCGSNLKDTDDQVCENCRY